MLAEVGRLAEAGNRREQASVHSLAGACSSESSPSAGSLESGTLITNAANLGTFVGGLPNPSWQATQPAVISIAPARR